MSIAVVVGTNSRTLYQSSDTSALLCRLSSHTHWQELVFGSVPLPTADQIGIKIHPGSITATSILFEYHLSPSKGSIDGESTPSAVIGICVLWCSPFIHTRHGHRVSCLLQNLKSDVEQALRDNSLYLLANLIDEFVNLHGNCPLTSHICPSRLPSLAACLHSLEPSVGLNTMANVLINALISYFNPRRKKLILYTRKSSAILKDFLCVIRHLFVIISSRSCPPQPSKTLCNEAIFIQDDLDDKLVWFEEEEEEEEERNSPTGPSFTCGCRNSLETQACSPAFMPDPNYIDDRQGRTISSEEESLGYFSSSSSQGSTIAIEGCSNDDINNTSEIDREICSTVRISSDVCPNHLESSINRISPNSNPEETLHDSARSVRSDGIRSFQEVLREYQDIRFRRNASTSSADQDDSDGARVSLSSRNISRNLSRNLSSPCFVAVRENNGFLQTFHQTSLYANSPASSSRSENLGNSLKPHSLTSQKQCSVAYVENLVNLESNGHYLLPHFLVQGLNLKNGDRVDNHLAYLSRCSCEECTYSDNNCAFKTLDLDSLINTSSDYSPRKDGESFILKMLRSTLQMQSLGLSDDHVTEFIRCKLQDELPLKAALFRSCRSSSGLETSDLQSASMRDSWQDSVPSQSPLDLSVSWADASLSSFVDSFSLSAKKVTSSIKSAISCSFNEWHRRNNSKSPEPLASTVYSRKIFWQNVGIHESDIELLSSLPEISPTHKDSPIRSQLFETLL